jgi:uncharacterized protein YjbJ (UPF0337 family)
MASFMLTLFQTEVRMFSDETLKGKWKEVKGEIINFWGNLSEDELEKTKGNMTSIIGLIQQRYGEKKESIQERLNQLSEKFASNANDVGSKLTDATENIKNRLSQNPANSKVSTSQKNSDSTLH